MRQNPLFSVQIVFKFRKIFIKKIRDGGSVLFLPIPIPILAVSLLPIPIPIPIPSLTR